MEYVGGGSVNSLLRNPDCGPVRGEVRGTGSLRLLSYIRTKRSCHMTEQSCHMTKRSCHMTKQSCHMTKRSCHMTKLSVVFFYCRRFVTTASNYWRVSATYTRRASCTMTLRYSDLSDHGRSVLPPLSPFLLSLSSLSPRSLSPSFPPPSLM